MADWEDVRRIVAALPKTSEEPTGWRVKGKPPAWERPLRESDIAALTSLGAPIPDGPILAARVPGLGAREALLADDPDVHFITQHFANYPAVLVRLPHNSVADLEELLTEAWLTQAPKCLATTFLASRP